MCIVFLSNPQIAILELPNCSSQAWLTLCHKSNLCQTYLCQTYLSQLTTDKGYGLRNGGFHRPRFNTVQYGKHSIRYLGPHIWSILSQADRENLSLESFKKNY